jgi:SAM-dependent methyltransferase
MGIDYTYYYRRWHPQTEGHRAGMMAYCKLLLSRHLPEDRGIQVLDVGCGGGYAMLAMRELGYKSLLGIDIDEGQVESAQAAGLEVQFVQDTVGFLSARPRAFQLILALDVLEHVPVNIQMEFVHAIASALSQGGRFICTVPNANSAVAMRWRYNDWTHHSSFTEHSLEFLLFNGGGFSEIQTSPATDFVQRPRNYWMPFLSGSRHWWAFRFFRTWRRLEMMAELGPGQGRNIPLSLNLLSVAKKS